MEIILRPERPSDYWDTEYVVKKAFWNLHYPGCNEHYLVHLLRKDAAYLPEISRVAEVDGKVAGVIMYSRAWVCGDAGNREILTFGPLLSLIHISLSLPIPFPAMRSPFPA